METEQMLAPIVAETSYPGGDPPEAQAIEQANPTADEVRTADAVFSRTEQTEANLVQGALGVYTSVLLAHHLLVDARVEGDVEPILPPPGTEKKQEKKKPEA